MKSIAMLCVFVIVLSVSAQERVGPPPGLQKLMDTPLRDPSVCRGPDGTYYLACSEIFDGRYSCAVATSTNIYGPYSARYEAIPHGGHNTFFQDEKANWWATYFGPPWNERPAILPVDFAVDGRVRPAASAGK